jgi:hypothetical protein
VSSRAFGLVLLALTVLASGLPAEESSPPAFLHDRGTGIASSIFGTYVRRGELLVYPFYEYVEASSEEYHGEELGYFGEIDYLGESREQEAVLFLAYGLSEKLAVELEAELYVTKRLDRAPEDTTTGIPERLEESGLGEIEGQLRWRISSESATRPELFSNLEVTFPTTDSNILIGAADWAFAAGFGAIKGFRWGTLTARVSIAYEGEEGEVALGEYAVEYLKRLSPFWRVFSAIEGEDDEISLILGGEWQVGRQLYWKLNSGLGLTEKAADFAPEVGLLLSF